MVRSPIVGRILPWLLRALWVLVLVLGSRSIEQASDSHGNGFGQVVLSAAGIVWLLGVAAMAIPSVVGLTATRLVVPLAVPVTAVALFSGADTTVASGACAVAVLATIVAFSGEVGRVFVQASAYGSEDRHLLRAPAAYTFVVVLVWALWATLLISGILALASRHLFIGTPITLAAVAALWWMWPRIHRLARRWFVFVPAGIVVHDHLMLAETMMLRHSDVRRLRLAPVNTEAADLTGPASGHAVEITTAEPVTVLVAPSPAQPDGATIHLTACLIAPTRPGQALTAASQHRFTLG